MKPANLDWLRRQWDELMAFYGAAPAVAGAVFGDLVDRYGENGRYYHTLRHIQNVLETIEMFSSTAQDIRSIQLAAWFHDVIYDVHRSDNEAQSAVYAGKALRTIAIPTEVVAKVDSMIRATKHNLDCPADIDCQIMLDADLATFASDWATQEVIERAIRQEYAFVPDEAYREGRRHILHNFLKRERIYCTEMMYETHEAAARQNISRTIQMLCDG